MSIQNITSDIKYNKLIERLTKCEKKLGMLKEEIEKFILSQCPLRIALNMDLPPPTPLLTSVGMPSMFVLQPISSIVTQPTNSPTNSPPKEGNDKGRGKSKIDKIRIKFHTSDPDKKSLEWMYFNSSKDCCKYLGIYSSALSYLFSKNPDGVPQKTIKVAGDSGGIVVISALQRCDWYEYTNSFEASTKVFIDKGKSYDEAVALYNDIMFK